MARKKKTSNQRTDKKCKLPPFEVEEVLSLQDARQKVGWNITAFSLPDAWNLTQGEGVTIAVLDTGCDLDHPDLAENLLPGKNFVNEAKLPDDDNQHGTHVTGIIVASNNDIGMVGVAPKAKVLPVKVLDRHGNGSLLNVAKGIRWAVDNGADILAMSLGSPRPTQEVKKALQYAASKNVVTFCAAGNAGLTQNVFYPALYPETIAIGAITEELKRATFSNTGKDLDFMAPGDKIFSTVPDNWYAILSGTSMACPFAVGVAALVLSYKRSKGLRIKLDMAEDYRTIFKKNTSNIQNGLLGDPTFYQGFGIIDPRKLVEAVKAYQAENGIN